MVGVEDHLFERLLKGQDVPCICCERTSCLNAPCDTSREDSIPDSGSSNCDDAEGCENGFKADSKLLGPRINGFPTIVKPRRKSTFKADKWAKGQSGLSTSYLDILKKFDILESTLHLQFFIQLPKTPLPKFKNVCQDLPPISTPLPVHHLLRRHTATDVLCTELKPPSLHSSLLLSRTPPAAIRWGPEPKLPKTPILKKLGTLTKASSPLMKIRLPKGKSKLNVNEEIPQVTRSTESSVFISDSED